jgi:hypothetical protein
MNEIQHKKYIEIRSHTKDGSVDPREVFYPVKMKTETLHRVYLPSHKKIHILTKCDIHRFVMYITLGIDADRIWISGYGIFINQNPERKVTVRNFCMKTKKWCCAWDETSNEFFSFCPHCGEITSLVINSDVPCHVCKKTISASSGRSIGFIKYNCINCPANIGLNEANNFKEFAKSNLLFRNEPNRKG